MNISDIRAFIPSKDYDVSKKFYESLGFKGESAGPDLTVFEKDGCTFFLQRLFNEALANNLMLQLIVPNIDAAHEWLLGLECKHSPIKREAWGAVIYLWGPSGELWHITELSRGPYMTDYKIDFNIQRKRTYHAARTCNI